MKSYSMTVTEALARVLVDILCDKKHMAGFFGDVSEEFRKEQVDLFMHLSDSDKLAWIELHRNNLGAHK